MRLVIFESPYAGDVHNNVVYAQHCIRECLLRGDSPIASHLLYTQPNILDDGNDEERRIGIEAGLAWMSVADASVVYTDRGITRGMAYGALTVGDGELVTEFRKLGVAKPIVAGAKRSEYNARLLARISESVENISELTPRITWHSLLELMLADVTSPSRRCLAVSRRIALDIMSSALLKPFFEVEQNPAFFLAGSLCNLHKVPVILAPDNAKYDAAHISEDTNFRIDNVLAVWG